MRIAIISLVIAVCVAVVVSCGKPDPTPPMPPFPPPGPLKGEFKMQGVTVLVEGAVLEIAPYGVDYAKKRLEPMVSILEGQRDAALAE